MLAITKTVTVAKPVSRRVAQEIREISCLTCLTNCAGDTFAITKAFSLTGYTCCETLMTHLYCPIMASTAVEDFLKRCGYVAWINPDYQAPDETK